MRKMNNTTMDLKSKTSWYHKKNWWSSESTVIRLLNFLADFVIGLKLEVLLTNLRSKISIISKIAAKLEKLKKSPEKSGEKNSVMIDKKNLIFIRISSWIMMFNLVQRENFILLISIVTKSRTKCHYAHISCACVMFVFNSLKQDLLLEKGVFFFHVRVCVCISFHFTKKKKTKSLVFDSEFFWTV